MNAGVHNTDRYFILVKKINYVKKQMKISENETKIFKIKNINFKKKIKKKTTKKIKNKSNQNT
jgi:hypothetical protein